MLGSNPLGLLPEGQALVSSKNGLKARSSGLGNLSVLSDELINFVFSLLTPYDLFRIECVSRTFYAFSRQEYIFKQALLESTKGRLDGWQGTWRDTLVSLLQSDDAGKEQRLKPDIKLGLCSDFLFQPALCAGFDPNSIYALPSFKPSIPYVDARTLNSPDDLPEGPCILQHAMDNWAAFNPPADQPERRWTLQNLAKRCPKSRLRAEAVLSTLGTYADYAKHCATEDTPAYLFDSEFCATAAATDGVQLEDDFEVPSLFASDLFKVLKEQRPDYRWLIVGPARSGSTFHKDPNHTSAWNGILSGSKAWIVFPEDVQPPGVQVSEDEAQVSTPDSVSEWFISYYRQCKALYGPNARDPTKRGKMQEGICRAGEMFYVPSRCWHLVINLEETVALTQNFVGGRELANVLYFMKHKPDQVSGFKTLLSDGSVQQEDDDATACAPAVSEDLAHLFEQFCQALKKEGYEDVLLAALKRVAQFEATKASSTAASANTFSLWDRISHQHPRQPMEGAPPTEKGSTQDGTVAEDAKATETAADQSSAFSFGFDLEDNFEGDEHT